MRRIYLDNAASTPIDPKVLKVMEPYFSKKFGNSSSFHYFGREVKNALNESRQIIAKSINAKPEEIIFTSGGTESNNFALKGISFTNSGHIITTKIEHDCILKSCQWLEKQRLEITYLDVNPEGFINLKDLEKAIDQKTILVSVIHANNEIGTIQDIKAIGKICQKKKVYFHTDACQSYTKVPIDVKEMAIDLMTINSHKIYGPKGIGALYIRKGIKIEPWQHGGGQEFGWRAGTENVAAIVGFAAACQLDPQVKKIARLQKYFIQKIQKKIEGVSLNGPQPGKNRLCNNINLSFKSIKAEALLILLDEAGIAISLGSVCSSYALEPSHVLKAIGLSLPEIEGSIRISLGKDTTKEEIDLAIEVFKKAVRKLREIPRGQK